MKNSIFILTVVFLLGACDKSEEKPGNEPPTVPLLVYPTNNLLCIENEVDFEWQPATDPNGDNIAYEVEIAKDKAFTGAGKVSQITQGTSVTVSLERGIAYYWRVRAVDSFAAAGEFSPINSFYVEGEGVSNYLPFTPTLVSPEMDGSITGTEVMLKWAADDIDVDVLMYDIYYSSENPPATMLSEDLTETSITASVESGKTYYWRVVVKDEKGGQTKGPIWSFKAQ